MKKSLLALALVAVGAFSASAQNYAEGNSTQAPYFGVRASFDLSCPSSDPGKMYKNGAGFSLGAVYNMPLGSNFYFEPGASLYYDTWAFSEGRKEINDVSLWDVSFRNFGLEIPLMFGYQFNFTPSTSLMIFTGPTMRIGFVNDMHYKSDGDGYEISDYEGMYGDGGLYNRFDCAWKFGAGLNFDRYYVGVSGQVGMVNLYKDNVAADHFRMNTVQFTIGYNF